MEVTRDEALDEARRMLGPGAVLLEERAWGLVQGAVVVVRHVGVRGPDTYSWTALGRGATWREALDSARAHEAGLAASRCTQPMPRPEALLP